MALVNRCVQHIPRTSDIEFFSSLHGRQKRLERGIQRRDLQAAVKYGKKQEGYPDPNTGETRWMYTWGNVVYITDATSTREITSYYKPQQVVEIPQARLTPQDLFEHNRAKDHLRKHPNLCTSHTVIVVDHSASMRTSDVADHVNRIKACFEMLARDFVAKQMATEKACNTDVVSVMLMHDGVDVLFDREPMSRVLFNRFVDIHDKVRPRSHGNFLPSLDMAERLLRDDANQPGTALCLLFLSDGKPSDNATGIMKGSNTKISMAISDRVSLLAGTFRRRLSVSTLGFASSEQDFSVLEAMAEAASSAGAKGEFLRPELSSAGLASAIASAVSSLTDTKSQVSTTLMAAPGAAAGGGRRALAPILELEKESADCEYGEGWKVYVKGVRRFEYEPKFLHGVETSRWQPRRLVSPSADGIAIRKVPFGEGAEKVVYKMQEYDSRRKSLVGGLFVAKFSKRQQICSVEDAAEHDESRDESGDESGDKAARALAEATKLANLFNTAVYEGVASISNIFDQPNGHVDHRVDQRVWGVKFLRCFMYKFIDGSGGDVVHKRILVEKWLDPSSYNKWNGNNGYVFRGRGQASVREAWSAPAAERSTCDARADSLMYGTQLFAGGGGGLARGGAVDYGTGAEEYVRRGGGGTGGGGVIESRKRGREQVLVDFRPGPTDYLQAFSHFSYVKSGHKRLVCDLQGVKSHNSADDPFCAGVFELTDPVIHSNLQNGRQQVYGRTDLGKKGMHKFFRTHDCNHVCRLLNLPGSRSPEVEAAEKVDRAAAMNNISSRGEREVKRPRLFVS